MINGSRLPKWTERKGTDKIYWLWAEGTSCFKFGFTQQAVGKRISNMQVSCPHRIRFIAAGYGSREDEQLLHRFLAKFRTVGEWFDLHGQEELVKGLADVFGCVRIDG
jgi:hypothetical protein